MLAKVLLFTVNLPFLLLFTSFTLGFFSAIFPPSFVGPLSSLLYGLNSLWTPNANSVRHLIRHINSISPLIAVIPLCRVCPRRPFRAAAFFLFFFFFRTLRCCETSKKDLFETRSATQWQQIHGEDNAQQQWSVLTHTLMWSSDPAAIFDL